MEDPCQGIDRRRWSEGPALVREDSATSAQPLREPASRRGQTRGECASPSLVGRLLEGRLVRGGGVGRIEGQALWIDQLHRRALAGARGAMSAQARLVGNGIQPAHQAGHGTEHLDGVLVLTTVFGEEADPDVSDAGEQQ